MAVKNEDESVQCDLCNKWNHIFCIDVSSAKYEKFKLSMLCDIAQYVQRKCHLPFCLIKTSIYSYPETLLILC